MNHPMRLPKVLCAICGRTVDAIRLEYRHDIMATEIKVRCHGDTDTMEWPDHLTASLSQVEIDAALSTGVAFATRRLAP